MEESETAQAQLAAARATIERLEAMARLHEAQTADALAQLAGGIAHDLNNILSVVLGYTSLLVEDIPADAPMHADVTHIHTAALRAGDLMQKVLAYSRLRALAPSAVELGLLVSEMEPRLRRLLGEQVEIVVVRATDAALVWADRAQLEQIVLTLALAAREPTSPGRRLSIETSTEVVTGTPPQKRVPRGSYVTMTLTDSGAILDEAACERIYEPPYARKDLQATADLGLTTLVGLVKRSGGHLVVESLGERGTTFKILLPPSERPRS